jgi:hypothetical protein
LQLGYRLDGSSDTRLFATAEAPLLPAMPGTPLQRQELGSAFQLGATASGPFGGNSPSTAAPYIAAFVVTNPGSGYSDTDFVLEEPSSDAATPAAAVVRGRLTTDSSGSIVSAAIFQTASAAAFTYDAPNIARVDVHRIATVEVGRTQLGDPWEWSASRSVEVRGTSTTPNPARNATNTVDDILPTPVVSNTKLQNIVNDLYKGTTNPGRVGTGTTADAVRNELVTGLATGGKFHSEKAQIYINGLNKVLKLVSRKLQIGKNQIECRRLSQRCCNAPTLWHTEA